MIYIIIWVQKTLRCCSYFSYLCFNYIFFADVWDPPFQLFHQKTLHKSSNLSIWNSHDSPQRRIYLLCPGNFICWEGNLQKGAAGRKSLHSWTGGQTDFRKCSELPLGWFLKLADEGQKKFVTHFLELFRRKWKEFRGGASYVFWCGMELPVGFFYLLRFQKKKW